MLQAVIQKNLPVQVVCVCSLIVQALDNTSKVSYVEYGMHVIHVATCMPVNDNKRKE